VQCDLPKCGLEKKFICHPCRVEPLAGPAIVSWEIISILESGGEERSLPFTQQSTPRRTSDGPAWSRSSQPQGQ
jgi:hypothetical protein